MIEEREGRKREKGNGFLILVPVTFCRISIHPDPGAVIPTSPMCVTTIRLMFSKLIVPSIFSNAGSTHLRRGLDASSFAKK